MRRAVLDPNVLISGLLAPGGTSARILIHLRVGTFELISSAALIDELRQVLARDKFGRCVTAEEAESFADLIKRESTVIADPAPGAPELSEDPGDEYLIRLARAAGADGLVSGDPHLIALKARIPVETPREFLDSLE